MLESKKFNKFMGDAMRFVWYTGWNVIEVSAWIALAMVVAGYERQVILDKIMIFGLLGGIALTLVSWIESKKKQEKEMKEEHKAWEDASLNDLEKRWES